MRDEGLVCTIRTHAEGDGSVSGEILVPVPDGADPRRLLVVLEDLDGWHQIPPQLRTVYATEESFRTGRPTLTKCWVSIILRVDASTARDEEEERKERERQEKEDDRRPKGKGWRRRKWKSPLPHRLSPNRGTYNAATNYHILENAAYAFQITRDEILPGLLKGGRVIVGIIMRVRYMPHGLHPTRPRR